MSVARVGHTATLLRNGQVLVAGGENSTNGLSSAELYNPATRKWTLTGSMATGRYSGEFYDPSTGAWTATHNLGVNQAVH